MTIFELLTADLRLALLLVGALLLIGIVAWEILQRRRASQADAAHQAGPPSVDPLLRSEPSLKSDEESEVREEASLTLPEMHVRDRLVEPTLVDFDTAMAKEPSVGIPVLDSVTLSDPVATAPPSGAESRAPEPMAMRLDWPAPEQQHIIGIRVIARPGERFTGVSLRQALLGEGFQHGELDIFHRPLSDGRVLLSAASLTKPGNFDLATMDSGLFMGLNLFAVLPGPLAGRDTVDKLLIAGHTLAQRLRGELRDARGDALTEARLTEMRREAAAGDR